MTSTKVTHDRVQVGDRVLCWRHRDQTAPDVETVARKTATQVVLSNGWRLSKEGNLVPRPDIWAGKSVRLWDAEVYAEGRRRAARYAIARRLAAYDRYQVWEQLSLETLEAVQALIAPELKRGRS